MSETPLNLDEIRKEIRQKHLINIPKDDPILAVATMIDLIIEKTADRYTEALTQSLAAQLDKSKEIGENIVNKAANFIAENAKNNINLIVNDAIANLNKNIEESLNIQEQALIKQQELLTQSTQTAKHSWYGASISLLGGGIFFGLIISHIFF
ncbi:hypothetical protein [Commensalibacter nepenthis]|uniref:Conjugal transfer protein TraM n=1 Tax=Commensalibacter nepenthis TaxID=3043872 RepID=A0ABT6QC50_9PROT|nr:hypothetical protein [Commensalibacter sp. TBRC 10068]MDI2113868.1 hypothetical protein [Commensalibacter sp. TBRC 10068]